MKKKRPSVLVMLILLVCIIGLLLTRNIQGIHSLPQDEIERLRQAYPVYGDHYPEGILMKESTLEQVLGRVDTIVYGEILGTAQIYYRDISTGYETLDKKREDVGLSNTYKFYEYEVSIIEDIRGELKKGDKITITSNYDFWDYHPHFDNGARVILPITFLNQNETRYGSSLTGTYYVT